MTDYKALEALPDTIKVICKKNGSVVKTFTDHKAYQATRNYGITFSVIDDLGHERIIIPNEPSPHLIITFSGLYSSVLGMGQKSVGVFEVMPNDIN